MNETLHHYYDAGRALRPYVYSLPANPGSLPAANAAAAAPPPVRPGVWPCWNGINWVETEDHRKREGQEATNYWLPGDTWETPARHMDDVGPLPDGALPERPEPEPPSLEEARAAKIAEINEGYETVIAWVQAGYPLKEVLSWETQASQARALQNDPQAEALFVRALAATKGLAVEEMAGRIMENARNWEPVAAMLTAQRQMLEEAAWAARSLEEVAAVKVGYQA